MNQTSIPRTLLLVLLAAWPSLAQAAEHRVTVHLKSGREVSGAIEGFDEARGVTLRRDDNGGVLPLRWHQLRPEDVEEIKRIYGFVGDELPPVQLEALKVTTATGSIVGLDEGRRQGKLLIRVKDNVTPVPLDSIRRIETVLVDALEVEHPGNVYNRKRADAPPARAVDHFNLGLLAESLALYDQARTDFEAALAADPNFSKAQLITQKIDLLAAKEKEKVESEALRTIRTLRYRGAWREAMAKVIEFEESWPRSVQLQDVQREKKKIADGQRTSLLEKIRSDFLTFLRRACEERGRNPQIELGAAMTWAKEQAWVDVRAKLVDLYGLTEEEVDELWENRPTTGSPVRASYAGGTFILGEENAKAGYDRRAKAEEEEKEAEQKEKPKSLEERIAEKLREKAKDRDRKKQEKKTVGRIADVPPSDVDWWKGAQSKERTSFLLAFFSEFGEKMTQLPPDRRDCSLCAGKGFLEFYGSADPNQQQTEVPCARCKTLTFDRIAVFK